MTSALAVKPTDSIVGAAPNAARPLDIVLTRQALPVGEARKPGPSTHYMAKGFLGQFDEQDSGGTLIQSNDVKITVLANTLGTVPALTDTVRLNGMTFGIVTVLTDPKTSIWQLQARPDGALHIHE